MRANALRARSTAWAQLTGLALRAHRRPEIAIAPLDPPAVRRITAVTLPGARRQPAVDAMFAALRDACDENGAGT